MKARHLGRAVLAGLGFAALAVAATASPAAADPSPATDFRTLAGVGSDTIQDLGNALGNVITSGGNKVVASWDARPTGSTIKTKATACSFPRPDGSGAGRQALRASEGEDIGQGGPGFYQNVNVQGCVEFARSSSYGGGTSPQTTGNYTYIPVGVDAVSLAVNTNSDLPRSWSFARVQRVYKCFDETVAGLPVTPLLIQSGSGTRQFWLQRMEITEQEITLGDYPCLESLGNTVQEHDGTVLTGHNDYVVPFSAGQFIAQGNSATIQTLTGVSVTERRGPAQLVSMGGQAPISGGVLNVNFPLHRDVYVVVPTADLGNATIASTFVGSNSAACTASVNDGGTQRNVVQLLGFGIRGAFQDLLNSTCGNTQLKFNS
jgi:hypothetical protein